MRFQNGSNKVAIELRVMQLWSEIILVISNRTRAARSFDFEITRMISDQIALHSVQLPLYISDFARDDCARNMLEVKSTTRQGLILAEILPLHVQCTPSLSPRVITWLEPAIQWKTQYLVSGQLQKTRGKFSEV